ncbi:unnamed protein product [Heligmosomoides polygyrus]|uniref:BLVR domain-containing protein n=1 Tax=Heligmosomoides polygyrus TaxID=6339 RepID=A0A183GKX8_HELPZ|nr:unnamed protein product [Heligmosomoides polygyrus]
MAPLLQEYQRVIPLNAGCGVVDSSEEISPVQLSEREIIDAKKESELRKVASKIMHKKKKEKPKVQSQTSSKEPPVLKPPRAKAAKEASKPAKKDVVTALALPPQKMRIKSMNKEEDVRKTPSNMRRGSKDVRKTSSNVRRDSEDVPRTSNLRMDSE